MIDQHYISTPKATAHLTSAPLRLAERTSTVLNSKKGTNDNLPLNLASPHAYVTPLDAIGGRSGGILPAEDISSSQMA